MVGTLPKLEFSCKCFRTPAGKLRVELESVEAVEQAIFDQVCRSFDAITSNLIIIPRTSFTTVLCPYELDTYCGREDSCACCNVKLMTLSSNIQSLRVVQVLSAFADWNQQVASEISARVDSLTSLIIGPVEEVQEPELQNMIPGVAAAQTAVRKCEPH